jgi:periplasmic protein TonB
MQSQNVLFVCEAEPAEKKRAQIILPPPTVEPLHEVFAETMLEDTSARHRRSPLDWAASIGIHAAILSALLILPLYYTAGLDFQKLNLTFLAPPMTPLAAPAPAPLASSAAPKAARVEAVRTYVPGKLTAPTFIPKAVASAPSESSPPEEASMGLPGEVPGGIPGGQMGGVIGGVLGGVLTSVPAPLPAPAAIAEGPKKPVRVGGDVKPPHLLFGPEPDYPPLARQARITGVVVIEAVIDEHGNVTGMRVVSGHPLLIPAAMRAVSKRKYQPTILDGEATPLDLRVEITFNIS